MFEDIEFIIPCGGKSTRNYPQAKGIGHKCLLPFGSVRLIDHILKQIFNAGGRNITIVCSCKEIIDAFKNALRPTPEIAAIMRQKGYLRIAEAIEETMAKIKSGELVICSTADELDAWVAANQYNK